MFITVYDLDQYVLCTCIVAIALRVSNIYLLFTEYPYVGMSNSLIY